MICLLFVLFRVWFLVFGYWILVVGVCFAFAIVVLVSLNMLHTYTNTIYIRVCSEGYTDVRGSILTCSEKPSGKER